MVKILLSLFLMLPFLANGLTADELKARMKGAAKEQESAEKRLKFLTSASGILHGLMNVASRQ